MAKRAATSELNSENWDKEEESEDPGYFQKASAEILETRVIRTAKRRIRVSDSSSDSKSSPFSGFTGFGNASSTSNTTSPFSFLNQSKTKSSEGDDKNGTKQENNVSSLTKETQPQFKSFSNSLLSANQQKDASSFSSNTTSNSAKSTNTTFKPFEHIFKASKPSNDNNNDDNHKDKSKNSKDLELLKDLNLSCSSWIAEHLQKNPYCILTPIFKDYEKHLSQLNLDENPVDKDIEILLEKTSNSTTETAKLFSPSKEESEGLNQPEKDEEKEKEKDVDKDKDKDTGKEKEKDKEQGKQSAMGFQFGSSQSKAPFNFQFSGGNTAFGAISTPFSLNKVGAKPISVEDESKNDDGDSEEPPKNEFVPVVEEDSIYDIKCKIFVKKDGNFVSRGVGTLFLKPVKDSTKTQLIVRAHTNLGNILLNLILVPGMPIQKTGKNNAMIVCVPTPEAKPPPIPVLIRVKTSSECDSLIKKLQECQGV